MKLGYNYIEDQQTRDTFKEVERDINSQDILKGKWKFYDLTLKFDAANPTIKLTHGLTFLPIDVIMTFDSINMWPNVTFDKSYLYITITADCRLRFLAGRYEETRA